jgi:hypothetical protein
VPDEPRKTVFVLGAGASAASEFELPTMNRFLAKLSENDTAHAELVAYLRKTFPLTPCEELNLEDVFTQIELDAAQFASISGLETHELHRARASLLSYVRERLEVPVAKGSRKACPILLGLLRVSPKPDYYPHTIISLNYDLIVDVTLEEVFADLENLPENEAILERSYDLLRPRAHLLAGVPTLWPVEVMAGKLLKLHGSVDWIFCPTRGCPSHDAFYPSWQQVDWRWPGLAGDPPRFGEGSICSLCGSSLQWVIVPPTMRKSFEDYPRLLLIWRLAHEELKAADRVVFFGVSMAPSDYYLHWLIRSSLVYRDPRPEVVVINPCGEAVERTKQLAGVEPRHFEHVEEYLDAREP